MACVNKVMLIGNIVKDPELRYTQSGIAICTIRLAMSSKRKNKEEVCFLNVEMWDKLAETVVKFKRKGDLLYVEGRMIQDIWEDKERNKRTSYYVKATNIQFLNNNGQDNKIIEKDVKEIKEDF